VIANDKVFDDNWIYAPEPEMRTGRITNFRNWIAGAFSCAKTLLQPAMQHPKRAGLAEEPSGAERNDQDPTRRSQSIREVAEATLHRTSSVSCRDRGKSLPLACPAATISPTPSLRFSSPTLAHVISPNSSQHAQGE
jgi:hypothetical protein